MKKRALFVGNESSLQDAFPPDLREEISARVEIVGPDLSPGDCPHRAQDLAQVHCLMGTWGMPTLSPEFLKSAPALEAIFYAAGSIKGFATDESYDRGILISSAWSANAIPVCEFTVASILLGLKRFWEHARLVREQRTFRGRLPVAGGYLSKVGLVSLGAIGKLVARRLGTFEMDLLAYDPFVDTEMAQELGVSLVSLEELFATCDVVSIHTPWLPETEGLISGTLISSMKSGAVLINTSRGAVVDEAKLCEVLAARRDLTAVLDVTYPEPPVEDSPLYSLPNVILTPHIAGSVGPEVARMGRWMADELSRFLAGQPLKHAVTREMLGRMA